MLASGVLVAALVGPGAPGTAAAPPPPQLRHEGRWLLDPQGRVVMLHGVNAVWKLAPYAPPDNAGGFTAADADFLAANGFNAVRLGVLFAGVMPQAGAVDQSYLDKVDRVVQLLAARRIWVQLDFHQDLYSEKFQGEGFPAWSVYDDGLPNDANYGFPGNYFGSLALNHTFDNLWANHGAIWDRYRDAWKAVAARWAGQPYLMGYDLINEPWPGAGWQLCVSPATGCPQFDATLQQFEEHVRAGIRQVDPSNLVWLETNVISNSGPPSHMGDTPVDDPQLGLSWHDYCSSGGAVHASGRQGGPDCPFQEDYAAGNAEATASRLRAAPLITEFGASDDLPDIASMTAVADEHLQGWMYWHYKNWGDPTTESQGSGGQGLFAQDRDLASLKQAKADLLVRPYPQAVAGVPVSTKFDPATHVFHLAYTPRPAGGPTEIFVPARHYPTGYVATVTGAHAVSTPNASPLQLVADTGAGRVDVELRPGTGGAPAASASPGQAPTAVSGSSQRAIPATGSSFPWLPAGVTAAGAGLLGRRLRRLART
jgi:endoglycosylceramidase